MPTNERFVSATAPEGWSVDSRGYIHGGFETPEFLKVKRMHNSRLTENKREIQALEALREKLRNRPTEEESQRILREKIMGSEPRYIQPVAVYGDPGFNHPTKKDSNA